MAASMTSPFERRIDITKQPVFASSRTAERHGLHGCDMHGELRSYGRLSLRFIAADCIRGAAPALLALVQLIFNDPTVTSVDVTLEAIHVTVESRALRMDLRNCAPIVVVEGNVDHSEG